MQGNAVASSPRLGHWFLRRKPLIRTCLRKNPGSLTGLESLGFRLPSQLFPSANGSGIANGDHFSGIPSCPLQAVRVFCDRESSLRANYNDDYVVPCLLASVYSLAANFLAHGCHATDVVGRACDQGSLGSGHPTHVARRTNFSGYCNLLMAAASFVEPNQLLV